MECAQLLEKEYPYTCSFSEVHYFWIRLNGQCQPCCEKLEVVEMATVVVVYFQAFLFRLIAVLCSVQYNSVCIAVLYTVTHFLNV